MRLDKPFLWPELELPILAYQLKVEKPKESRWFVRNALSQNPRISIFRNLVVR